MWSFHHDDEQVYRGGPPCFWEIYSGDPVTGSVLQRLTERLDGGVVLHKGWFRTIDHSYARNRDQAYFGGADWPARVAADIRDGITEHVDGEATASDGAPIYRNPRGSRRSCSRCTLYGNFISNQLARAVPRRPVVDRGLVEAPIETFLDAGTPDPRSTGCPSPAVPRYLADPFGASRRRRCSILAEDFDYRDGAGPHRRPARRRRVLPVHGRRSRIHSGPETGVHASYPFAFGATGALLCVPETYAAREIAL